MRVLVVEDDDRVARGLLTALRHAGYEVHRVATAADALRAAPADVVLLDLGLPDGDGLDVLRELRHRPGTAVITVTARGEERERVLARTAPARRTRARSRSARCGSPPRPAPSRWRGSSSR